MFLGEGLTREPLFEGDRVLIWQEPEMEVDVKVLMDRIKWLRIKRDREEVARTAKPEVKKYASAQESLTNQLGSLTRDELLALQARLLKGG